MSNLDYKLTNQRFVILEFLKNNYNHPTVDEIYEHVKLQLPRISKKTVYNNLKSLSEKNYIEEINVKGVQRYEPKEKVHPHFICNHCGKIYDIDLKDLIEKIEFFKNNSNRSESNKNTNKNNFEIESYNLNFYGTCAICKQNKRG